jgi:hypothetical protein
MFRTKPRFRPILLVAIALAAMASGCTARQTAEQKPRPVAAHPVSANERTVIHIVAETTSERWGVIETPAGATQTNRRNEYWYDPPTGRVRADFHEMEGSIGTLREEDLQKDGVWTTYVVAPRSVGQPSVVERDIPTSTPEPGAVGGVFTQLSDWRKLRDAHIAKLTAQGSADGTATDTLRLLQTTQGTGRETVVVVRRSDYLPVSLRHTEYFVDARGARHVTALDVADFRVAERIPLSAAEARFDLAVPRGVPVTALRTLSRTRAEANVAPRVYWAGDAVAGLSFEGKFVLEKGRNALILGNWPWLGDPEVEAHYSDPAAREALRRRLGKLAGGYPEIVVVSVPRVDPAKWPHAADSATATVAGHAALRSPVSVILDMGDATVVVFAKQGPKPGALEAAVQRLVPVR